MSRIVSWFSCGAASAVATKLASATYPELVVAYCQVAEEHTDNVRFLSDCEQWFGVPVVRLISERYNGSCFEVFKTNFFRTPSGSPCTRNLKTEVRRRFQEPNDTLVFGFTIEEQDRFDRFIDNNNEVSVIAPLIEQGLTKSDVLAMIERAGIKLPVLYGLGYEHNNCVGCVKGGMGYWNKIRVDFPERFYEYAKLERQQGYTILKDKAGPIYLDELDPSRGRLNKETPIQCGVLCEIAETAYNRTKCKDLTRTNTGDTDKDEPRPRCVS